MSDLLILLGASLATVAVMAALNLHVSRSRMLKMATFSAVWAAGALALIALARIAAEALR